MVRDYTNNANKKRSLFTIFLSGSKSDMVNSKMAKSMWSPKLEPLVGVNDGWAQDIRDAAKLFSNNSEA